MSFEASERPFVETSFTTKWLDYASFAKPVVVWAPDYSSAHRFATRHGCGTVVATPDPTEVEVALRGLLSRPGDWARAAAAMAKVRDGVLNPDRIHETLVGALRRVMASAVPQ
jgi:hypothetical protein